MKYKTIMRISDVVVAIEDWKRDLITDDELARIFLKAYNATKAEAEPVGCQKGLKTIDV